MKKCPECGGKLLRIVYGLPTEEAFKHAKERGLYFAGCCVDIYKYRCEKCKKSFIEDFDEDSKAGEEDDEQY